METTMINSSNVANQKTRMKAQEGFTLIEVVTSIFIIMVGLVSLLGVMSFALASTQTARQDMIARQLAQESLEAIITARETADITWDQIQNVGPGNGIFVTGFQPIRRPGADGIIGTADDSLDTMETIQEPGADGIVGTPDDLPAVPLTNFQRSIAIGPTASGDLRTVTITIQYFTSQGAAPKSYVLSGMISQYR